MNLVFIHGHGANSDCFAFLRQGLPGHDTVMIDYASEHGFAANYESMLTQLRNLDDLFFVAHSLGGIYALHLANALPDQVLGAVTISTPYGGSQAAQMVKFMLPFHQVLRDIQPGSPPIEEANRLPMLHPWTNIVTTEGRSSLMLSANDGVVTQHSMRRRADIRLAEVDSNHFDVLLHAQTLRLIEEAIEEVVPAAGKTRRLSGR